MQSTIRLDIAGALAAPISLPDGSVRFTGRVARTGDHSYPWGVERRDASELHTVAGQLRGKPLLDGHPQRILRLGGFAPVLGKIISATVRGDHATAEIEVTPAGVARIEQGVRELSLGYETDAIDGRQTNTRVDHVALVPAGRCGATCAIRTDCKGAACKCSDPAQTPLELRASNLLSAMRF